MAYKTAAQYSDAGRASETRTARLMFCITGALMQFAMWMADRSQHWGRPWYGLANIALRFLLLPMTTTSHRIAMYLH